MSNNVGNPFVSLLVLFYNLEDSVDYCLESLLAQTYKNYEIVCVDDGSTDATRERLLAYELMPNVRVVTIDNGGVSRARNIAIEHACGDYVSFIDGDDVVSPYYLEFLVRSIVESKAEQALGKFRTVLVEDGVPWAGEWPNSLSFESLDRRQITHRFLYEEIIISPCCRLARRDLYLGTPFPEGKIYEDTLTFANQILSCNSFALVDVPIYGYVKRWESITKPNVPGVSQIENFGEAITRLAQDICMMMPMEKQALVFHTALDYTRLYRLACNLHGNETADKWRDKALDYVQKHFRGLLNDAEVSKGNKLRFFVLRFMPFWYNAIFDRYETVAFKRRQR